MLHPERKARIAALISWGLLAAAVFWYLAPWVTWHPPIESQIMPFRAAELEATRLASRSGLPPLVAPVSGGSESRSAEGRSGQYRALGFSDDLGIYLIVGSLSADSVSSALHEVFVLAMIALLIVMPLTVASVTNHFSLGLLSPIIMGLGVALIWRGPLMDVYWVQGWVVAILCPAIMAIFRADRSGALQLTSLLFVLIIAAGASLIRSHAGLGVLLSVLMMIGCSTNRPRFKLWVGVLAMAIYGVVMIGIVSELTVHRDQGLRALGSVEARSSGHPFWHTAYIGLGWLDRERVTQAFPGLGDGVGRALGRLESPCGIKYLDEYGFAVARARDPNVPLLSDKYAAIVRSELFNCVADHPFYFGANLLVKGIAVALVAVAGLAASLLSAIVLGALISWSMLLSFQKNGRLTVRGAFAWRPELLAFAGPALVGAMQGLVAVPTPKYVLGLSASIYFALVFSLLFSIAAHTTKRRKSPWELD